MNQITKVRLFIEDTISKETLHVWDCNNEAQMLSKLIAYLNQMGIIKYTLLDVPEQ